MEMETEITQRIRENVELSPYAKMEKFGTTLVSPVRFDTLMVGLPYIIGRTNWRQGSEYFYNDSGHTLRIFKKSPTRYVVDQIRQGPGEFALFISSDMIFFLYQIYGPWQACPYHWQMLPTKRKCIPAHGPVLDNNCRAILQIHVVEAMTGILLAMRVITMPSRFTRALHEAILHQVRNPFNECSFVKRVHEVHSKYPTPVDMVMHSTVLSSVGPRARRCKGEKRW
jgi:hypothetical protein